MAIQTLDTIKNWFRTSLKPTQQQFWDTWDSFRHKDEKISVEEIDGVENLAPDIKEVLTKGNTYYTNGQNDYMTFTNQYAPGWQFNSMSFRPGGLRIERSHNGDSYGILYGADHVTSLFSRSDYANELGFRLNTKGLLLKTNAAPDGAGIIKTDNLTKTTDFQLPAETAAPTVTLVSRVNGIPADINGNVNINGQGGTASTWQQSLNAGSTSVEVQNMRISLGEKGFLELNGGGDRAFFFNTENGINLQTRGKGEIAIGNEDGIKIDGQSTGKVSIRSNSNEGVKIDASSWGEISMSQNQGLYIDSRAGTLTLAGGGGGTEGIKILGRSGVTINGNYFNIESGNTNFKNNVNISGGGGIVFKDPSNNPESPEIRLNYVAIDDLKAIQLIGNMIVRESFYLQNGLKFKTNPVAAPTVTTDIDSSKVTADSKIFLPSGIKGNSTMLLSINDKKADVHGNISLPSLIDKITYGTAFFNKNWLNTVYADAPIGKSYFHLETMQLAIKTGSDTWAVAALTNLT
ncbi:hypothetical protein [Flavobacterium hungaricum]|uniref:Uncharacterized protein n=1 Tax=Flavobacterium hungaricum TaxID=2082725 RepID=A0ABR9TKC7_9FLAO|nr:hypothetical protein [Flavobacterium hungaricum]MBE8725818.1 hypothetical protein [Flavobacterium hungaricum]